MNEQSIPLFIQKQPSVKKKLSYFFSAKVPNIRNRPRLPVPEEDPYSMTGGSSSGGSSGKEKSGRDKPPKLPPPRDSGSSNKSSSKVCFL